MQLKWTKQDPYERSIRQSKQRQKESQITDSNQAFSDELANSAYASSLNHDENTWDILTQSIYSDFKISNKREYLDDKISQRELMQQRGSNPFLQNTNYLNDMSVRDTYLKPRNTTFYREKKQ